MGLFDEIKDESYKIGDVVECRWDFFQGCPPNANSKPIKKGTFGKIVKAPKTVPDVFGPIQMAEVEWDDGRRGPVNVTLLKKLSHVKT